MLINKCKSLAETQHFYFTNYQQKSVFSKIILGARCKPYNQFTQRSTVSYTVWVAGFYFCSSYLMQIFEWMIYYYA